MAEIKLVVLGAGQTGKSALTIQFVQGNFAEVYDATVEDSYRKTAEVDGKACQLSIMDTAGQEEYGAFMKLYYEKGDGFLLVYSVLDANSMASVEEIHRKLVEAREADLGPNSCPDGAKVPIVVVGNKIDLLSTNERQVDSNVGHQAAREWKCTFFETSAKTRENVEAAFHELIRQVKNAQYRKESLHQPPARSGSHLSAATPQPAQDDLPPVQPPKKKKKKKCVIL